MGKGDMTDLARRTSPQEWAIVDELYTPLRRFAAVCAPPDLDPDDLLQEALVRVLTRRTLSSLDNPGAYLRRCIVNAANSHNYRMGAQRRAIQRWSASEQLSATPTYPSDLASLYALPVKERAALYLAEVEGYHFDEIAGLLGCTPSAARKRASRGRRRLRAAAATEGAT
jgi:RNA polymerase sigma-70 factor (ECF subfamily)